MRLKIFVLIAILFGVTIFGIVGLRYIQIGRAIKSSTEEIGDFAKKLDLEKRRDILEYLNISMIQMDSQIQTIFDKIGEIKWVQDRLLPANYSQYANHFEESAKLMLNNAWIDLIQTTAEDKLASSIVVRPPDLESYTFIPVDKDLNVIVKRDKSGKAVAFIGVPFWADAGDNKIQDYLLFGVEDLLKINTSELSVKKSNWETNPLDSYAVINHSEYMLLMKNAIESIRQLQQKMKERPELVLILMNPKSLEKFVTGNLYEMGKESELKNAWSLRYDQNQLIWKIGHLFGSGIWNFNPLEKLAPKGICSLKRTDLQVDSASYPVVGILMDEIVQKTIIPVSHDCDPKSGSFCTVKNSEIINIKDKNGVYFTKTMVFNNFEKASNKFNYGTLTFGISMNQMLRQLAFIIPGSILFVNSEGNQVFFHQNGEIGDAADFDGINFKQQVHEKTGMIKNINGKEFLFVHLGEAFEGRAHVFVLELRQNVFQMLISLNGEAALLLRRLFLENVFLGFVAIVIGLLALNHILKKGIAPLTNLAETTKLIASGHLDGIHISEEYKKRSDEIGMLCNAFDQMVNEMRLGIKVRSLLDKVVSKEIANKILKDGVQLGGEVREVTILFADIRNFTVISEKLPPQEVLEMLNSCLTVLSKVIDDHRGIIDKYIGDEIMAIFGAPVDTKNPAFEAVTCAKIMIDVLREWNVSRESRKLLPLKIGISIHTGQVIAGNIGADNHLSYTVLGHNVNLASRIADHAKGMEILITEETLLSDKVSENISVEPLPPEKFKGISKPIRLFKVVI